MAEPLYTLEIRDQSTGRVVISKTNIPAAVLAEVVNNIDKLKAAMGTASKAAIIAGNIAQEVRNLGDLFRGKPRR